MKLFFDQNISYRILQDISSDFPGSVQTRMVNLDNATDTEVWNFAKNNQFTIVTFDVDFVDLSLLRGFPPKIIWLRTGNVSTIEISDLLISKKGQIEDFIDNPDLGFLELR